MSALGFCVLNGSIKHLSTTICSLTMCFMCESKAHCILSLVWNTFMNKAIKLVNHFFVRCYEDPWTIHLKSYIPSNKAFINLLNVNFKETQDSLAIMFRILNFSSYYLYSVHWSLRFFSETIVVIHPWSKTLSQRFIQKQWYGFQSLDNFPSFQGR